MTVPFICLFIGALAPIFLSWVGGYFRFRQFGSVDNKNPRGQSAQLDGAGARAVGAQQNAWEALIVFTAGVLVNHVRGGDPEISAWLASVWVASRFLHAIFYLIDLDRLRSLSFIVSLICALALFFV